MSRLLSTGLVQEVFQEQWRSTQQGVGRLAVATTRSMDPKIDAVEYLDRCGVTAYMKDVVTLLLENRPEEPIEFICKYFRTVTLGGSSPLLRAYRYIQLAPPTAPVFSDNLVAAYIALDSRRLGVTGAEVARLLRLLCAECPLDVSLSLLLLSGRTESEQVAFDEFSAIIRAGLLYDEFFSRARALFASADAHGTGHVRATVMKAAVRNARGEWDVAGLDAALRHEQRDKSGWTSAASSSSSPSSSSAAAAACASAKRPGSSGGSGGASDGAPPVATRAELHRLQREVQWEVARLGGAAGGGSAAGTDDSDDDAALVGFDEFMRSLFEASLGSQPRARAAKAAAQVNNYKNK